MLKSGKKTFCALLLLTATVFSGQVAQAKNPPTPLKVGAGVSFELDANETKDYTVSFGKGAYRLVWDAARIDNDRSNIIARMHLLKPNGAMVDSYFFNINETDVNTRVGKVYNVAKPFVARLRIVNNNSPLKMWLRIVPVAQTARVPFGWGAIVTPARISSDNGVGGTLEPLGVKFHSITLPKGKWSISLGLQLPDGESSNLQSTIHLLDAQGFITKGNFVIMNESGNQARTETVITILKPRTVLLRVNNHRSVTYTYDVTIEPAS